MMWQRYLLGVFSVLVINAAIAAPQIAHLSLIQVTHLKDYQFGAIDTRYDSSVEHSLCVRDAAGTGYTVTVSSTTNGSKFEMRNLGGQSVIPYHVFWSASAKASTYTELKPNIPAQMQNADPLSTAVECGGNDNASLEIKILANELHDVSAGQYSTGLEITVAPI